MIFKRFLLPTNLLQNRGEVRKLDADLFRYLDEQAGNLSALFDHGISFEDNLDGVLVSFTSNAVANTEDAVAHALGRVPVGFLVRSLNKGAVLYNGGTADTDALIHFKSSVASTAFSVYVY